MDDSVIYKARAIGCLRVRCCFFDLFFLFWLPGMLGFIPAGEVGVCFFFVCVFLELHSTMKDKEKGMEGFLGCLDQKKPKPGSFE